MLTNDKLLINALRNLFLNCKSNNIHFWAYLVLTQGLMNYIYALMLTNNKLFINALRNLFLNCKSNNVHFWAYLVITQGLVF